MAEMAITFPDDFDELDQQFAESIVPDDSFVTSMMTILTWMDSDGELRWRLYNATGEGERSIFCVGLLEMAKLDLIARCDNGIPLNHPEFEESDDE